jgi:hypothetical protein
MFLGFAAPACGAGTRAAKAPPPTYTKPGASISHTKLCGCTSCSPASCCQGTDEGAGASDEGCGENYDFSNGKDCGLSVGSCTTRCFREVWRVRDSEACDAKRPPTCCGAASD